MRGIHLSAATLGLTLLAACAPDLPPTLGDELPDSGLEVSDATGSERELPPALGDELPDSRLEVFDATGSQWELGQALMLSALEGKPIVLDFWASWCGTCPMQHRQVTELKERYGDRITVLGVNFRDTPEAARGWLKEHGATYPTVTEQDGALAEEFWLSALPYFALLTPDRRLSWDFLGASREGIPDSVTVRLEAMLGS